MVQWSENNKLQFNVHKCAVFVANRSRVDITIDFFIREHRLVQQDVVRDLGLLLDRKLTFGHNIEQITTQARQMIGLIKNTGNGRFSVETQRILYIAYVRSKLKFASQVWSPHHEIYLHDLESVQ